MENGWKTFCDEDDVAYLVRLIGENVKPHTGSNPAEPPPLVTQRDLNFGPGATAIIAPGGTVIVHGESKKNRKHLTARST